MTANWKIINAGRVREGRYWDTSAYLLFTLPFMRPSLNVTVNRFKILFIGFGLWICSAVFQAPQSFGFCWLNWVP